MPLPAMGQVGEQDAGRQQFLFAYRLFERGDDALSAESFDAFLESFPNDPRRGDGMYYRATLLRRAGDSAGAAKLLDGAPKPAILPESAVALLRGQVLIDTARHGDAIKALESIKAEGLDPATRASVLYLRGLAYRGAGNNDAAITALREAAALPTPLAPQALLDLARVLDQAKQTDAALEVLTQAMGIKDNALAAESSLYAGALSYQAGKYDRAVVFYERVVTQYASSPLLGDAVLGVMWSRYAAREYDNVIQFGQPRLEAMSDAQTFTARYLIASAQQDMGQHAQAIATLVDALTQNRTATDSRDRAMYKLAVSLHEIGKYEEMSQIIHDFSQRFPQSPLRVDAEFLQASAQAKQGDAVNAAARFTAIIQRGDGDPYYGQAILGRARLFETTGQPVPALVDYEAFLAYASGRPGAETAQRTNDAALRVVALQTQLGKPADADALAAKLIATGTLDPLTEQEALFRRVVALSKEGKRDAALATVNELFKRHPQNRFAPQGHYYRGMLLVTLGRGGEATADLRAAADSPELTTALRVEALRLASIQLREGHDTAAAVTLLRQIETLAGPAALEPDERLWLARHLIANNDPAGAITILAPLASESAATTTRSEAWLITGIAQRTMNKPDAAIASFDRIIADGKGFDVRARLEVARTLSSQNKSEDAIRAYTGLVSAEASEIASAALFESAMLQHKLADTRRQAGDPVTARRLLEESRRLLLRLVLLYPFKELSPLPERGYLELAEVETQLGEAKNAASHWRELTEKFPESPHALYAKAMLTRATGRSGDAEFILKKLRDQKPDAALSQKIDAALAAQP